jgi:hypothetical protein
MNNFLYSPTDQITSKEKPNDFWELFSKGTIALDDQSQEDFQFLNGFMNKDSVVLKKQIENYCSTHRIKEIPAIAKARAIMFLEIKFKEVSQDFASEDKSKYLKTMFSDELYESIKKELTRNQKEFSMVVMKEIIKSNKSIKLLNIEKPSTIEEKIKKLGSAKLKKSEDTRQMKVLIIQLYYYYLSRYQEFLTACIQPDNEGLNKNKICFIDGPGKARKSDEKIENYLEKFRDDLEQRKIVNYPESIYDLVVKCEKELDQIKSEVGINHEIYLRSSTNVVYLTTDTLFELIEHPVTELLLAPIQGLKLGRNMFEECDVAFNEINKIEMDSVSMGVFNARKEYFESLKQSI